MAYIVMYLYECLIVPIDQVRVDYGIADGALKAWVDKQREWDAAAAAANVTYDSPEASAGRGAEQVTNLRA